MFLNTHAGYTTDFNSYFLQVAVLFRNTENEDCVHEAKKTAWISVKDELPLAGDFEFTAPPHASDRLLMCRIVTGENNKNFRELFPDQGMKVINAGSFSKASPDALARYYERKKTAADESLAANSQPRLEEQRIIMRKIERDTAE